MEGKWRKRNSKKLLVASTPPFLVSFWHSLHGIHYLQIWVSKLQSKKGQLPPDPHAHRLHLQPKNLIKNIYINIQNQLINAELLIWTCNSHKYFMRLAILLILSREILLINHHFE